MATHFSVLAWRILGTEEPGGLLSMGSHRVGHDWSDLAAAAATDVGNLISGSSAFSKLSLYIWNFSVCVLLKPILKDFEHYLTSMWNEHNCMVVWRFFGIAFHWDYNEDDFHFPVLSVSKGNRDSWGTQTKPCVIRTQGKGPVTTQEAELDLPVSVSGSPAELWSTVACCRDRSTGSSSPEGRVGIRPFGDASNPITESQTPRLGQFSSVQLSDSVLSNSLQLHGLQHTRPPCPSSTPRVYSNSCPLSRWCPPTISFSVIPFSHLQSFPASGSFPMSQFFASGGQSIGVSASASVLPMNIWDWFHLGWTGWISLLSKGLSRVFSNTTVQKHRFFGAQLSL